MICQKIDERFDYPCYCAYPHSIHDAGKSRLIISFILHLIVVWICLGLFFSRFYLNSEILIVFLRPKTFIIMKKTSKLSMLLFGAMLFASVSFTACNSGGDEKKDAPADSPAVAPKMETTPPPATTPDSGAAKKVDSPKVQNTRPNSNPPTP